MMKKRFVKPCEKRQDKPLFMLLFIAFRDILTLYIRSKSQRKSFAVEIGW